MWRRSITQPLLVFRPKDRQFDWLDGHRRGFWECDRWGSGGPAEEAPQEWVPGTLSINYSEPVY
jgi:hypothetical protein